MIIEMPDGKTYTSVDQITMDSFTPKQNLNLGGLTPTDGQARAADVVAKRMKLGGHQLVSVIGYAGTGKTTLIRGWGQEFTQPLILAPTGKAALRVNEATGLPACTIHRWLYRPVDGKDGKTTFEARSSTDLWLPPSKLVIIDEASMVSLDVWADLWRVAERYQLKIVTVGDGFQLPPVQDGNKPKFSLLNRDYVKSLGGETIELTEVLRQAQDSLVVRASMRLRAGEGIAALKMLPNVEPANLLPTCLATREARGVIISHANVTRYRVNAGMRGGKNGPQSGEPLLVLRNNYDVDMYNGEQVTFDGWKKLAGEPVCVTDKYSGDVAYLTFGEAIVNGQSVILCVQELDGALANFAYHTLAKAAEVYARHEGCYSGDSLTPFLSCNYGYCYTAHKAQGSEWSYALYLCEPSVKLNTEEGRRHAYTAITRAKEMAAVYIGKLP